MKILIIYVSILLCASCIPNKNIIEEEEAIQNSLTQWHEAASKANYNQYFDLMTSDAVFIGTDASENWKLEEFKTFSKPYFDKGKAWSFKALERNIFQDATNPTTAWFDELLNTQMGICRGSGVMRKQNGSWKIQHYVLSIAVPNEHVSELTEIKKDWDAVFRKKIEN
ncbi:nuclear transport factor 2 family protein [Dokdonia sp. Hel_I_53]|uniref:nuclear transport factor 2 family protein n=1 Tax=Dokdonia sp. Hel_I_53 TaxID=1566287 RepID=UPI00119B9F43|nr:nuclear transport factor 2 family protein [Dokdonia sp. Hel_I_53]TVZ52725.1 SnoaL-like protein [Dokdonia sp. Hel_I_53]